MTPHWEEPQAGTGLNGPVLSTGSVAGVTPRTAKGSVESPSSLRSPRFTPPLDFPVLFLSVSRGRASFPATEQLDFPLAKEKETVLGERVAKWQFVKDWGPPASEQGLG
uniref:Uncharacterized protein n=1 Tax=Sphaerodactylus townsendi TaxID=933632 RepID=A0ACB8EP14_9SAUR